MAACARLERQTPRRVQGAHHLRGTVALLGWPVVVSAWSALAATSTSAVSAYLKQAPVLAIGAVDVDDLHPSGTQEADQSHPEGAAALDTGTVQRSKLLLRPSHQRSVTGLRRRQGLVTEAPTKAVEGYPDVRVCHGVYAHNDERLFVSFGA